MRGRMSGPAREFVAAQGLKGGASNRVRRSLFSRDGEFTLPRRLGSLRALRTEPPTARNVRESVSRSGLHDRDRLSGVHVAVSDDGTTGFWNAHDQLRSGSALFRAQIAEALSAAISEPWCVLRGRH